MSKFQLKDIIVDATQWFTAMGEIPGVRGFEHGVTRDGVPVGESCITYGDLTGTKWSIADGDWVVTKRDGSFAHYKPDAFAATYEPSLGDAHVKIARLGAAIEKIQELCAYAGDHADFKNVVRDVQEKARQALKLLTQADFVVPVDQSVSMGQEETNG